MTAQWQGEAPQGVRAPGWLWPGLLLAGLALLGGSARPDAVQDVALRPLAALLLIPALASLRAADLAGLRLPLVAGGAFVVWMVVQLVPLPPVIWQALPERSLITELDRLAGLPDIWRPISLAPFRGLGSVLGMLVPLAALLLALSARLRPQTILLAIAGLGAVNAVLGILQVLGGPNSAFYLYAFTNRGAPVGIFANENHASVFAAIVLLVLARLAVGSGSAGLAGRAQPRGHSRAQLALGPAYLLVLLGVLIGGSRAGLACAVLAMLAGGVMVWSDWRARGLVTGARRLRVLALFGAGGVGIALMLAAFFVRGRAPGAADLFANGSIADIRWSLWPVLGEMIRDHWLAGTGFGSFESTYRIYEPTALLLPQYVNHAHNDWAQLVIEGGLPAALCLLILAGWVVAAIIAIARHRGPGAKATAVFWAAWLTILITASLVDYPLRTPTFAAVSMGLLLCLAQDRARFAASPVAGDNAPVADRTWPK